VLLDLNLRGESGLDLLPRILEQAPGVPVIVITGNQDLPTAVACMRLGAHDYLVKPVDAERLLTTIRRALDWQAVARENERLRDTLLLGHGDRPQGLRDIVAQDPRMLNLLAYAEIVADSPRPVLVTGESGTGKELVARALHNLGQRAGQPWVSVNVAGLDPHVFADTLFGHVRGAYTGANEARDGLVEQAGAGSLLLDEIGDLQPECQVKLLRLLQENEYRTLGSDQPRLCRARIIATSNRDLEARVREGTFRADLYYRLHVHHLHLPPLRERPGDIPLLAAHFLQRAAATLQAPAPSLDPGVMPILAAAYFPGNARELETLIFDAATRFRGKQAIPAGFFKERLAGGLPAQPQPGPAAQQVAGPGFAAWANLPTLPEARRQLMAEALHRTHGNQSAAARMLGITPQALSKHLSKSAPMPGSEREPPQPA
jgi:DNA-binding NtrC family response regulator